MASYKENKDFSESVLPYNLLDEGIDFIQSRLAPSEVFDEDTLIEWAEDNGYFKEDS